MLYQHLILAVTRIFSSEKRRLFIVKVTKFEINKDDQLIVCTEQLVIGRLGVQRIELSNYRQLDQTVIETECDIL